MSFLKSIIFKNYIIIPIIYHLNSLLKKYRHNEFEKKMKQIAKRKNNNIDIEEIMKQYDIFNICYETLELTSSFGCMFLLEKAIKK